MWRTGTKVLVNVYDEDRPVCQCHNVKDAAMIVVAVNYQLKRLQERTVADKPLEMDGPYSYPRQNTLDEKANTRENPQGQDPLTYQMLRELESDPQN